MLDCVSYSPDYCAWQVGLQVLSSQNSGQQSSSILASPPVPFPCDSRSGWMRTLPSPAELLLQTRNSASSRRVFLESQMEVPSSVSIILLWWRGSHSRLLVRCVVFLGILSLNPLTAALGWQVISKPDASKPAKVLRSHWYAHLHATFTFTLQ